MAGYERGASGQTIMVFCFDSTTGKGKTGESANITVYYKEKGGSVTVLTDTTESEIDSTNAPGYYEVDLGTTEIDTEYTFFFAKCSTANIGAVVEKPFFTVPAGFSAGTNTVTLADGGITSSKFANDAITAAKVAADVSAEIADAVWDEDIDAAHQTANTAGKRLDDASTTISTNLNDSVADIQTDVTAILADTNELQTDWVDGGRLDLILDARASQTSVDGLNDLSAADVNAEVDTALADYDGPTHAELTSAVSGLSTFDHTTDQVQLTTATQDQINSIEASFTGVGISFTVTGTPSTTSIDISGSDLGDTNGDHNRQGCFMTSGGDGVIGIFRWITTYVNTGEGTGTLTFGGGANDPDGPWPNVPAAGTTGRILGRR